MVRSAIAIAVFLSLFAAIHATQEISKSDHDEFFVSFDPREVNEDFIKASYIPIVRGHPDADFPLIDRPEPRRFGNGKIIPFGDDAVLSPEELRRLHVGRRSFLRKFGRHGDESVLMDQIPFSEANNQDEIHVPRDCHHHRHRHGGFFRKLRKFLF